MIDRMQDPNAPNRAWRESYIFQHEVMHILADPANERALLKHMTPEQYQAARQSYLGDSPTASSLAHWLNPAYPGAEAFAQLPVTYGWDMSALNFTPNVRDQYTSYFDPEAFMAPRLPLGGSSYGGEDARSYPTPVGMKLARPWDR